MVDQAQAVSIVTAYLATRDPHGSFAPVLQSQYTIERPFGWVFFYNTQAFVESGDDRHMLIGNAPLIIDRQDGSVHVTGTRRPIEWYIAEYERAHPFTERGDKPT